MAFWRNYKRLLNNPLSMLQLPGKLDSWQKRIKTFNAWLAIGTVTLIAQLPRKMVLMSGAGLGMLFYHLNQKRRKIALANLQICFPHWPVSKRLQVARQHFKCYGQAIVDLGMLWLSSEHRLNSCISYSGIENWQNANRDGRPVIFLTPHVVGVDLTGTLMARHVPMCAMMKDLKNSVLNNRLKSGRCRFGLKLYSRTEGVRPLIRNLRNNVACLYIPDEDLGLKSSMFVPFFGEPASTLTTLGRMARITNAVVLPIQPTLDATTGQYDVIIGESLKEFPTDDEYANARRMNSVFEDVISQAPEQYMWTLRWFKTRPENGTSPY